MPFGEEDHGEWTCPKCGNVYRLGCQRYPARDSVELHCECGQTIFDGQSTHDYFKSFVRKGNSRDAAKNPPLG